MIALFMYVGTVPVLAVVGSFVRSTATGIPDILAWILLVVAVADYGVSLSLEGYLLSEPRLRQTAQRRPSGRPEGAAVIVAVITSAFGVSIAIYGLLLGLLSFATWPWYFYGLAALHGIHLQLRWDRYEDAVRKASR